MPSRDSLYVEGLPAETPSEAVLAFLLDRAGSTVVDVGCGHGAYAERLAGSGRAVTGTEIDPDKVAAARSRGVESVLTDGSSLPFDDDSFETAVLVDVLEHVDRPAALLGEAVRVARTNVLVTVPNVGEYERLARYGITYWHLVTTDHVGFFDRDDLEALARAVGASVDVRPAEPLEALALVPERGASWYALAVLRRVGVLRPVAFNRLYAEFAPARP